MMTRKNRQGNTGPPHSNTFGWNKESHQRQRPGNWRCTAACSSSVPSNSSGPGTQATAYNPCHIALLAVLGSVLDLLAVQGSALGRSVWDLRNAKREIPGWLLQREQCLGLMSPHFPPGRSGPKAPADPCV